MSDMCGWYEINPAAGSLIRMVYGGEEPSSEKYYVVEGWSEALHEMVWDFHEMLAAKERPPTDEIIAFIVDGVVSDSFGALDSAVVEKTGRELAELWEALKKEYQEVLGREPHRLERYWTAFDDVRKMTIGRGQFYAGKTVRREEWFLYDFDLIFNDKQTWARLRVFDDASADAWTSTGLAGFDNEQSARTYIGEGHYASLDALRKMPQCAGKVPQSPPAGMSDEAAAFRYFGSW